MSAHLSLATMVVTALPTRTTQTSLASACQLSQATSARDLTFATTTSAKTMQRVIHKASGTTARAALGSMGIFVSMWMYVFLIPV